MTKELRERFEKLIEYGFWWSVLWLKKDVWLDELWAFIEQEITEAERRMKERCLKCIPEKKDMPDHECATFECEHYPRTDTHNMLVDEIRTAISSLK